MVSDTNGKHTSAGFIPSPESNSFTLVPMLVVMGTTELRLHCS